MMRVHCRSVDAGSQHRGGSVTGAYETAPASTAFRDKLGR